MATYNKSQKQRHLEIIKDFLIYLNQRSKSMILKGGVALLLSYNLPRFYEDINPDGSDSEYFNIIKDYIESRKYSYRVQVDTNIVKRLFINYGDPDRLLKIESFNRLRYITNNETINSLGKRTYTIGELAVQKSRAYKDRDRKRDIFDVAFIVEKY